MVGCPLRATEKFDMSDGRKTSVGSIGHAIQTRSGCHQEKESSAGTLMVVRISL